LTQLPRFTPSDRVLVIAPHPDDESIATGGLLQVACAGGAHCRVLLITDGDNNPWPQRWSEKRWRLDPAARARWGARRRTEAIAALRVLGVPQADVRCFGLPDLGLTDALMSAAPDVVGLLRVQLAEFQPGWLILPALEDRHPDHSALHVAAQLALAQTGSAAPRLYTFGVHGALPSGDAIELTLSQAQVDCKRAAILQHATQMQLSRKRFIAFAKPKEAFHAVAAHADPNPGHPLQGVVRAGELHVEFPRKRGIAGQALFVVARQPEGTGPLRWRITLGGRAAGTIIDTVAGRARGNAAIDATADRLRVRLPMPIAEGWIKVGSVTPGLFVLDAAGWQALAPAS